MSQGFTFGDFTAEEWEKYFSNSAAQIGNIPPVEVKISSVDLLIMRTSGKLCLISRITLQVETKFTHALVFDRLSHWFLFCFTEVFYFVVSLRLRLLRSRGTRR